MKLPLLVMTFVTTAAVLMGGEGNPGVTYIDHGKVSASLVKSASLHKQSDLLVMGSHRLGPGHVELHEKETDVFYVVEGEATLITGGKMLGSKVSSPGQRIGTEIQGGQAYHLTKGDVIVIPAGIPHWFKEVPNSISYFVVKVVGP
jgi:glc operon protein GlcG